MELVDCPVQTPYAQPRSHLSRQAKPLNLFSPSKGNGDARLHAFADENLADLVTRFVLSDAGVNPVASSHGSCTMTPKHRVAPFI